MVDVACKFFNPILSYLPFFCVPRTSAVFLPKVFQTPLDSRSLQSWMLIFLEFVQSVSEWWCLTPSSLKRHVSLGWLHLLRIVTIACSDTQLAVYTTAYCVPLEMRNHFATWPLLFAGLYLSWKCCAKCFAVVVPKAYNSFLCWYSVKSCGTWNSNLLITD